MSLSPWADPPRAPVAQGSPLDLWALSKQIDGLGGEWGFDIFTRRAWNFHFAPAWLYEPLRGFDDAWLSVWMRQRAASMGVPPELIGGTSISFKYWASMLNSEDGTVPMPSEEDRYMGQHSVQVIGIPSRDQLAFVTGWSGWAKGDGIGLLTREYVDAHATALMADRAWDAGPLGETTERLFKTQSADEFQELWTRPRTRELIRLKGPHHLEVLNGWSYTYARAAQLYTVLLTTANGAQIRVASAVVHHLHGRHQRPSPTPTSQIVDFFVWPTYRRQHYGRMLEHLITNALRRIGTTKVTCAVWDADCVTPVGRDRALQFCRDRKYDVSAVDDRASAFQATREL